jgi:hypothetical protein
MDSNIKPQNTMFGNSIASIKVLLPFNHFIKIDIYQRHSYSSNFLSAASDLHGKNKKMLI